MGLLGVVKWIGRYDAVWFVAVGCGVLWICL